MSNRRSEMWRRPAEKIKIHFLVNVKKTNVCKTGLLLSNEFFLSDVNFFLLIRKSDLCSTMTIYFSSPSKFPLSSDGIKSRGKKCEGCKPENVNQMSDH